MALNFIHVYGIDVNRSWNSKGAFIITFLA